MSHTLARAIYDNIAETPDELAFQKGDVLVILEKNTNNLEGWWMCSLRGRQGLCPANRVRIIPAVFDNHQENKSPINLLNDVDALQQQGKRRSWHVQPNKVLTPKKFKDIYLYDNPSERSNTDMSLNLQDCYDIPPVPICLSQIPKENSESYDIPRSLNYFQNQLTLSASASSIADSVSSSNKGSILNIPDYDVPKSVAEANMLYDIPTSQLKDLPLELSFVLETIEKLQEEAANSILKFLQLASSFSQSEFQDTILLDIKVAIIRFKTSLQDFTDFCERVLENANKVADKGIVNKFRPLVSSLQHSNSVIKNTCGNFEQCLSYEMNTPTKEKFNVNEKWNVKEKSSLNETSNVNEKSSTNEKLNRKENLSTPTKENFFHTSTKDKSLKSEEIDQLVIYSRSLTEDIRQISSFIQGNGTLLFKKSNEIQTPQGDYDVVSSNNKHVSYVQKNQNFIDEEEKEVLLFFASQAVTYHSSLTQEIDEFLNTVEHNQPPKIFLAHAKSVVVSAHKLVSLGDALHRCINFPDFKMNTLNATNALSQALANTVLKTKQAVLQFPSVTAVQEMVDSIVDISHSARDVKLFFIQAIQFYQCSLST